MKLAHLGAETDMAGLLDRESPDQMPAAERPIHMTRLDLQEFLRPRAAVPGHGEKVAEILIADMSQDAFEFLLADDNLPTTRSSLVDMPQRGLRD
jgi:hypothetical protein